MISKAKDLKFDNKKIFMIIAGVPGIGKTTLALSSPRPLLIDLDNGISRVEANYRSDTEIVKSYEELVNDLKTADLSAYETLVIDTGGKLLEMLKPVVIAEDKKNSKRDGDLSLQGYGACKRKFAQFVQFVKTLDKHLVMIFHATEVKLHDDITGLRIRMEGGAKDEIWDEVDIGGFVEMVGNERKIGFTNCERYYAKGTHGVHGLYAIPELKNGSKNTFVTDLFAKIKNDLNSGSEELSKYQEVIDTICPIIQVAENSDDLNRVIDLLKETTHYLTSKAELWQSTLTKAKELGVAYDKETKLFR